MALVTSQHEHLYIALVTLSTNDCGKTIAPTLESEASTNFCTSVKVLLRSSAVRRSGADVDVGDGVVGLSVVVVSVTADNLLC